MDAEFQNHFSGPVIVFQERRLPERATPAGYSSLRQQVMNFIDMSDRTIDLLFRFLHQNEGHLSNRARERKFKALTDAETQRVERSYHEVFGGPPEIRP